MQPAPWDGQGAGTAETLHLKADRKYTMKESRRDTALKQAAACAKERYPGEHGRIDRGLVLALNDAVTIHPDMSASVQSGTDREVVYTVRPHICDCQDYRNAPDGRCKHRYSVLFTLIANEALDFDR